MRRRRAKEDYDEESVTSHRDARRDSRPGRMRQVRGEGRFERDQIRRVRTLDGGQRGRRRRGARRHQARAGTLSYRDDRRQGV